MGNSEPKATGTGSGKEIAMLVGVLMLVAVGTVVTYWVRSRGAEAAGQPTAAGAAATPAPTARPRMAAPAPADTEVIHADVYFDFKSTRLRADAVRLLQDKAALLDRDSAWAVLVQGYADHQGPAEYNRALAQRRATAVKQFLVELGVPEASIKVVTIGQEGALCDEPSAECNQLSRRVHLEIRKLTRAAAEPVRPVLAVGDTLDTLEGRRQQP
jgi:outer membrane protein OmpA-like peptidoglycan-associated protein